MHCARKLLVSCLTTEHASGRLFGVMLHDCSITLTSNTKHHLPQQVCRNLCDYKNTKHNGITTCQHETNANAKTLQNVERSYDHHQTRLVTYRHADRAAPQRVYCAEHLQSVDSLKSLFTFYRATAWHTLRNYAWFSYRRLSVRPSFRPYVRLSVCLSKRMYCDKTR